MEYYNKVLNGNIPLDVIEMVKKNQNNYRFKHHYPHYQIRKNMSNVKIHCRQRGIFESDVNDMMNSYWAPVINKSLELNRDKILAGVNNILTKSLEFSIEYNKIDVLKIGLLNDDCIEIKRIINLVAKTFGDKFLELIKGLKFNHNLSDLHIKLVHLSGLTNLTKKEIDDIAAKTGLELELSLLFKVNTTIDIVKILSEILTPKMISVCSNRLSYKCLFDELYIDKLSQIILGIWESILENIMTLSKYKQISFIYAFSVELADTLFLQSKLKDNIIENFEVGNKTKLSDTTKIRDLKDINKNIDQSRVMSGMASFLSSAVTNAVNKNSADLLRSIAASNKLTVNGASGSSFTLSNVKQNNNITQETNANFVQQVTNKVINDIANKITENIDTVTKQLSNDTTKLVNNDKTGSSIEGVVNAVAKVADKAIDGLVSVMKTSVNNSVEKSTTNETTKELIEKYNLNQSFKLDKNNNVNTSLSNILSTENLAKCAADTKAENSIDLSKINVSGPIEISHVDQNNVVKDVMKCAFNQTVINDIANKIINDYDNIIKQMLENVDERLDDQLKAQMQGDILAAGVAGSAVCQSVGVAVSVAAEGVGRGVSDAATGVGSGVSVAAKGVGEGVGSIMKGMTMPLIIGGGVLVLLIICFAIYKFTQSKSSSKGDSGDVDGDGDDE
jgi:hypothetical protein